MKSILLRAGRLSPVILVEHLVEGRARCPHRAGSRLAEGYRRGGDTAPYLRGTLISITVLIVLMIRILTCAAAPAVTWERTDESIACKKGDEVLWQFNYGIRAQKPYFHPLRVAGGESLTASRPADHRWHYGLWFSWKYINGVNYWEEDKSGHSQGATTWERPIIKTQDDGSADINMTLRYMSPSNGLIMIEQRDIRISAPSTQGEVTIDWLGNFQARNEPLLLDRTPMPGEPNGAVNGGYAGFAMRAAQEPAECSFVTAESLVEKFENDRARPNSKAAACNIVQSERTNGVAIFSHVSNTAGDSPWYIINSKAMRWFSPSLLAPAPKNVKPRESFSWKFRVVTKAEAWSPEELKKQSEAYNH